MSHKPLPWIDYINGLCLRGLVSLITIDEAHYVHHNGRHIRPDFLIAMATMKQFVKSSPVFLRVIAMSASMCDIDRDTIVRAFDVEHPTIIGGPLN